MWQMHEYLSEVWLFFYDSALADVAVHGKMSIARLK
jgi:hypothetical protein